MVTEDVQKLVLKIKSERRGTMFNRYMCILEEAVGLPVDQKELAEARHYLAVIGDKYEKRKS